MRITEQEKRVLIDSVRSFDNFAKVWLFGSRVDDLKKGGDIDIAVLSNKIRLKEKMRIRRLICDAIGEQKIDIVLSENGTEPFFRLATERGLALNG